MDNIQFEDYSVTVKGAITASVIACLYEAAGELHAAVVRNTRSDLGQLKGSWDYKVDEDKGELSIGSPLENAIWEEFGTGEYAVAGDGRKGGWYIPEERLTNKAKSKMVKKIGTNGKVFYFTKGKYPQHTLQNAFDSLKDSIIRALENALREGVE